MKWRKMPTACLALLLTASLSSAVMAQATAPAYTLTVTPASPTSQDVITLKLAGTWPDNCPPNKLKATLQDGNINVDMLLPGAEDGNTPVSKAIPTAWQQTINIGSLMPGTYTVYGRGVSYTQTGGYVKLGTIQVVAAPASQTPSASKPATEPNTPKQPTTAPTQKPSELAAPDGMKSLALGVVVVLMDDSLAKDCGLQAGQCGSVLACEGPGHTGMVLVTWPFYGQGVNDACKDEEGTSVAYPLKSARWMDTKTVPLALCFDECGVLSKGQGDAILFTSEDGPVYNLIGANALNEKIASTGQFHIGDHVRVRGLLQVAGLRTDLASACPRQKGDIYGPILCLCAPPEDKIHDQCPGDKLIVDLNQKQVRLYRDPQSPGGKYRMTGTTSFGIQTSNKTALEVSVTPCPGVGGTWKGSLSVDKTDNDTWTVVKVYVDVDGIDLTNMPVGKEIVVAQVLIIPNK
jgi:hypothetical protein